MLLQAVSALLLSGFGVSHYRVNRIRVSDLWLTTRPAVAWLVRMTMTGAGVVVDGNGMGGFGCSMVVPFILIIQMSPCRCARSRTIRSPPHM